MKYGSEPQLLCHMIQRSISVYYTTYVHAVGSQRRNFTVRLLKLITVVSEQQILLSSLAILMHLLGIHSTTTLTFDADNDTATYFATSKVSYFYLAQKLLKIRLRLNRFWAKSQIIRSPTSCEQKSLKPVVKLYVTCRSNLFKISSKPGHV